jgi:hypothetical protein
MRFEEDPAAGMRGEFEKQIKRGWYIGSEEFRERLDALLMKTVKKTTSVTGKGIAERTGMGHPSTASLAINRIARGNSWSPTHNRKKHLGSLIVT